MRIEKYQTATQTIRAPVLLYDARFRSYGQFFDNVCKTKNICGGTAAPGNECGEGTAPAARASCAEAFGYLKRATVSFVPQSGDARTVGGTAAPRSECGEARTVGGTAAPGNACGEVTAPAARASCADAFGYLKRVIVSFVRQSGDARTVGGTAAPRNG